MIKQNRGDLTKIAVTNNYGQSKCLQQVIVLIKLSDIGHQGGMVAQALSPHSKKVLSFESESGCFCEAFACSPHLRVGLLQVLWFPPTVQKHVS